MPAETETIQQDLNGGSLKTEQRDARLHLYDERRSKSSSSFGLNGHPVKELHYAGGAFGLCRKLSVTESLILAQIERWRHGLGMQVER